ncbi:NADH:ubiquinone oxidoreductase subunit H [Platysternon megacephalum]|uniref:NADH:ubiquinone oxidoreductase subunit H n=1 Tax=Platysternon megacephalum TaxID=55544 RepID=A0A4D9DEY9_9SAUR|nr:NADH:ubiquinone oxidoreductase subunit H [Platysternon megacephalum]
MKQVNLSKRLEHVQSARAHFMDFLKLCKNYQIGKFHLPPTPESPNESEPTESTSGAGPAVRQSSLVAMASSRQAKIERYKQKKEVENRLASMKAFVESDQAEDEQIREFYVLQIQKWITTSLEEIESIDQEMVILRGRNALKQVSLAQLQLPHVLSASCFHPGWECLRHREVTSHAEAHLGSLWRSMG